MTASRVGLAVSPDHQRPPTNVHPPRKGTDLLMSDTARTSHRSPTDHSDERAPDTGGRARTSAAAVFALIFGLLALLAALTGLLAPVAVVLGIVGLILAIIGMKAGKKPHTTGRGVAIGGLVLAVIGLLIGIAALIGVASVVSSNPQILDQITNLLNNARSKIPGA